MSGVTVADTSPLIALARISAFHLLEELLQPVVLPPAVFDDVVTRGATGPRARRRAAFTALYYACAEGG